MGLQKNHVDFLQLSHVFNDYDATHIFVYVDGSGKHGEDEYASWAFAAFLVDAEYNHRHLGFLASSVQLDCVPKDFVGASSDTVGAAEITTQIWAMLWKLQLPAHLACVPLVIMYDSEYAANVT